MPALGKQVEENLLLGVLLDDGFVHYHPKRRPLWERVARAVPQKPSPDGSLLQHNAGESFRETHDTICSLLSKEEPLSNESTLAKHA